MSLDFPADLAGSAWERVISRHSISSAEYVSRAGSIGTSIWFRPLDDGKWTPAQITDHLIQTYKTVTAEINGDRGIEVRSGLLFRTFLRWVILPGIFRKRALPRRAKAPREVAPHRSGLDQQTALAEMREAAASFESAVVSKRNDANISLTHHLFGPIDLRRGVDFITIHIEHHGRQLPVNSER